MTSRARRADDDSARNPITSRADQVRHFYDSTAAASPDFSLMNYGYADEQVAVERVDDGPEHFCLRLYHRVLRDTDLEGMRVLEVSCGRGGGANFIKQAYRPRVVCGLDLSKGSIELARRRFGKQDGLRFEVGNAERLPYEDDEFGVVLNVEASHLYDDREKFFCEVRRVLVSGGWFFFTDLFDSGVECASILRRCGFSIEAMDDITANVLEALRRDSVRREKIIEETIEPGMREEYKNWSGIENYRAYNRLRNGDWTYLSYMLKAR